MPELARRAGISEELAERLLDAAELGPRERFVRADARNALLQAGDLAARAAGGRLVAGWSHTDPQILATQGVMSAAVVEPLARFVFPALDGVPERLAAAGAAFLDVGAGVAEIGLELCRRYEHLRVVGLEPSAWSRRPRRASSSPRRLRRPGCWTASRCATSASRSSTGGGHSRPLAACSARVSSRSWRASHQAGSSW